MSAVRGLALGLIATVATVAWDFAGVDLPNVRYKGRPQGIVDDLAIWVPIVKASGATAN